MILVLPFPLQLQPPTVCMATVPQLTYLHKSRFPLRLFAAELLHFLCVKVFFSKLLNARFWWRNPDFYQWESQTVAWWRKRLNTYDRYYSASSGTVCSGSDSKSRNHTCSNIRLSWGNQQAGRLFAFPTFRGIHENFHLKPSRFLQTFWFFIVYQFVQVYCLFLINSHVVLSFVLILRSLHEMFVLFCTVRIFLCGEGQIAVIKSKHELHQQVILPIRYRRHHMQHLQLYVQVVQLFLCLKKLIF